MTISPHFYNGSYQPFKSCVSMIDKNEHIIVLSHIFLDYLCIWAYFHMFIGIYIHTHTHCRYFYWVFCPYQYVGSLYFIGINLLLYGLISCVDHIYATFVSFLLYFVHNVHDIPKVLIVYSFYCLSFPLWLWAFVFCLERPSHFQVIELSSIFF